MIEYWKRIFQESWNIYIKNFKLIVGSAILCFLPLVLIFFLPIKGQPDIVNENNLVAMLSAYTAPELIFILCISILVGGLMVGLFHMIYKLIKGSKPSIRELPKKFHVLPKIILPYFIFFILVAVLNAWGLTILSNILGVLYSNIIIFYILIVIIDNSTIIKSIDKLYKIIKNNSIQILQFILINMFLQYLLIFMMFAFVLIPVFLIPLIIVLNVRFYVEMTSSKI